MNQGSHSENKSDFQFIKDEQKVNYIIGIGRSGTTLLMSKLNHYNDVSSLPELPWYSFFYSDFNLFGGKFDKKLLDRMANYYAEIKRRHPLTEFEYNDSWLRTIDFSNVEIDYKLTNKLMLNCLRIHNQDNWPTKFIIDKNPSYSVILNKIIKTNPDAKFIIVTRDYRANILSRIQSIEFRTPDPAFNSYRWVYFHQKLRKFIEKYPNQCMVVKYEDLVSERHQTIMDEVVGFLEINSEIQSEKYFDFEAEITSKVSSIEDEAKRIRTLKKYNDLSKPVNNSRVNAWKEQLSSDQIQICEHIAGIEGSLWGYQRSLPDSIKTKLFIPIIKAKIRFAFERNKERLLPYLPSNIKIARLKNTYHRNP